MPTLEELTSAFIAADDAGNHEDAQAFADEIEKIRSAPEAADVHSQLSQSMGDSVRADIAKADGPSAAGAFAREGARSVVPGVGGFMAGAATGAGLGAMGLNPVTIALGSIGGGILGGMGIRMGQDELADTLAPDSFMGSKSAAEDYQSHPVASLVGGALAQGRPAPLRLAGTVKNLATSEGRALLSAGLKAEAPLAAKVAINDAVDIGAGTGVGAGMSLASGDGMTLENAGLGALFSRGWIGGGPKLPAGHVEAQPNTNTGLIPVEPLRGPVTRMGNGEIEPYSPPVMMPTRPLLPRPTEGLPAPAVERLPAPAPAEGLPAPIAGDIQSRPVANAGEALETRSRLGALEDELVNNRVRREQLVDSFRDRGMGVNKGDGRKAIDILDKRARSLEGQITGLRDGSVIIPPAEAPRPIVEVDNRTPRLPSGPVIEVGGEALPVQAPPVDVQSSQLPARAPEVALAPAEDRASGVDALSAPQALREASPVVEAPALPALQKPAHLSDEDFARAQRPMSESLEGQQERWMNRLAGEPVTSISQARAIIDAPAKPIESKTTTTVVEPSVSQVESVPDIADYLATPDLLSGARYAAEQAQLRAGRTGKDQHLVSRVDGFHIEETPRPADKVLAKAPTPVSERAVVETPPPAPKTPQQIQLSRLEAAGKGDTPQAKALRARVEKDKPPVEVAPPLAEELSAPAPEAETIPSSQESNENLPELSAKPEDAAAEAADPADPPEKSKGIRDSLKAHSDRVKASIKRGQREGRNYAVIPGLDPVTAKRVYTFALDATVKAIDAGKAASAAIKQAIADMKAAFPKMTEPQTKAVASALAADAHAHIRFSEGRDAHIKVEMARMAQEFAAKGIVNPTKGDFVRELAARFPDQAAHIRKNIDSIFDDMMFARQATAKNATPEDREWAEWTDGVRDRAKSFINMKDGATVAKIIRFARVAHDTLFTGIGFKAHNLANGKHTGKRSTAFKAFAEEWFGVKTGEDGIQRVSADLAAEMDVKQSLNEVDRFSREIDEYFHKKGMPRAERAAWMERITEHMVDPSRDGELKSQPELKKAVEFFVRRRKERLAYMRSNLVDVGDAGERSASRVMDPLKVLNNRAEFISQATKAYRAKGLDATEAKKAAEQYFYAIESGERGVSSDGNDIFGVDGGTKADSHKSREFGKEADDLLGKFMFRDAAGLDAYETTAAVRAATRGRMLASKDAAGEIDPVGKWKKLRADMEEEGNGDMVPLAAQLVKDYLNLGGSSNPAVQKALELNHAFTQLAYLAKAGISNLAEPALIGLRSGRPIAGTIEAYRLMGRHLGRRLKGMPRDEAAALADALGLASSGMGSLMGASRLQDAFGGRGGLGEIVGKFHIKTLLTDITMAMHEASASVAQGFIGAELRAAKAGRKLSHKNLTEIGIGKADIDRMIDFTEKISKQKDKNAFILADNPDAKMYRDAITLFNRSGAVLDPTRGSRAQKANTPAGSLFYSLQSFLYEFHQKVTMRHFARAKAGVTGKMEIEGVLENLSAKERADIGTEIMAGLATLYSVNFGIQALREVIYSDPERIMKDKRRTTGEVIAAKGKAAASRTNLFGPYDLFYNLVTKARYDRDPATTLLGPTVGGMSEMFATAVNIFGDRNTDGTNTAERKLARTLYSNTVAPAASIVGATMPGRWAPGLFIQGGHHPAARESFVKTLAGPPKIPKGPMKRRE